MYKVSTQSKSTRKNNEIDITEYESKNKNNISTQNKSQRIDFSEVKFFTDCANQLSSVAKQAKLQQQKIKHQKRIKKLQETNKNQTQTKIDDADTMLIYNIIIDYFRSYDINYTYSVFMRQKDILHEDLVLKKDLSKLLQLQKQFNADHRLNVPILEIILNKLKHFQIIEQQKKQKYSQTGIQVQLLQSSGSNNALLWDVKMEQLKKDIQKRQKKYYQSMMHSFKEQELLKVKQELTKLYEEKQKKTAQKYQTKLKDIIDNSKNQINYKKYAQKNQQYLTKIQSLNQELIKERQKTKGLSFRLQSHNCFDNQSIKKKEELLRNQRSQMIKRKQQFQLALRNMDTKIEDLIMQKQKIMDKNRKGTDQFLLQQRQHKQNKDYMIEQIYGRIHVLEKRVQILSNDNNALRQVNRQLKSKTVQLQQISKQSFNNLNQNYKKTSIFDMKPQTKNFSISCSGQEIDNQTKLNVENQSNSENDSQVTINSEEFEQNLRKKNQYLQRVRKLQGQMKLLKNKVRYMVQDFA